MHTKHKRISAAVLSLALGFSTIGSPVFIPTASAQTTITAGQASTVDTTQVASLTIEKYLGEPVGQHGTTIPADTTLTGFEAEFTIQQVTGINLTTVDGWNIVKQLSDDVATGTAPAAAIAKISGLSFGTDVSQTTEATDSYSTTFSNLGVGVYLVTETPQDNIQPAKPFFVTLPYTTTDGTGWSYDLTVKPKNQGTDHVTKTVADELATLGSTSTYTIEMTVPSEGDLTSINVKDTLPAELTYVADSVKVYHTSKVAGNEITSFANDSTAAALDLKITDTTTLGTLKGKTLIVEFDATIIALPTPVAGNQGGDIDNHASIDLTIGGVTTTRTTDPDGPTTTRLGTLTITKKNSAGATITADSANFQVWRCSLEAGKWKVVDGGPLAKGLTEPKTTDFSTTDGEATIDGVQMADYVNDAEVITTTDTLCVVETKAPEGYVLNPEPQPVTVTVPYDYTMTADVTNLTQEEGGTGQLPATGGGGTLAMIAAGVLVAIAGGFAALRGNRGGTRARR